MLEAVAAHRTNNDSRPKKPCTACTVQRRDDDESTKRYLGREKPFPPDAPGARKADGESHPLIFSSGWLTTQEYNTQGLGSQMYNSNEVTQKCQQRHSSPTTKYQFLGRVNSLYSTTHMVFEGEFAVKFHSKDFKVGTSANINPRKDQVTVRRVRSHGSAND